MTKRHHRQLAAVFAPKPVFADNRYGVHVLDNGRDEILPPHHREAAADDDWLSPEKSPIIRECKIKIAHAERQTLLINGVGENDLDLRGFCEDAKLTERQTEVVVLTGEGWSQRAIADWLKLSQPTVWYHLRHGRAKLAGWLPLVVVMKLDAALSGSV